MTDAETLKVPEEAEVVHGWLSRTREVMVFRRRGEILACSAICPHMGARLEGDRRRDAVVCPWHGLAFTLPEGRSGHPRYARLKTYAPTLSGGLVLVEPEDPA